MLRRTPGNMLPLPRARRDLSQAAPAGLTMLTTMERGVSEKGTGRGRGNLKKSLDCSKFLLFCRNGKSTMSKYFN